MLKRVAIQAFKLLVIFISFYYLYRTVYPDLLKLKAFEFNSRIIFFTISGFIIYGLFFFIKTVLWFKILKYLETPVNYPTASKIWFASQIIKYIPGKIWFIVSRVYFARELMSRSQILFATFLETILMLISPILVFNLTTGTKILQNLDISNAANIAILISTLLCLIGLHPYIIQKILNFFTTLFKSAEILIPFHYKKILKLFAFYCLNWLIYGLANYLLIVAFLPTGFETYFQVTAVFAIAYLLAFLSFITPGGVGVKEAIQVFLLTKLSFPGLVAVAVSVIARLIWNFYELLGAIIFVGFKDLLSARKMMAESTPEK